MKTKYKAILRYGGNDTTTGNTVLLATKATHFGNEDPFYLLPATPEAYAAQCEAVAEAIDKLPMSYSFQQAGAYALAAIDIKRPLRSQGGEGKTAS